MTELMQLIGTSQALVNLSQITFEDGPNGVAEQFNKLWSTVPKEEYYMYCDSIPVLYQDLLTVVCDWIATIPQVGPVVSLVFEQEALSGGFEMMSSMFYTLPLDAQDMFIHPELLKDLIRPTIDRIRADLGVPYVPQTAGSFFGQLASNVSAAAKSSIQGIAEVSSRMAEEQIVRTVGPSISLLHIVGADQIVVNKSLALLDRSIDASVQVLKIVFSMFYALLLVNGRCLQELTRVLER